MPERRTFRACAVTVGWIVLMATPPARGFQVETHRLMSIKAARESNLDAFIKSRFPEYAAGLQETDDGFAWIDRIGQGAVDQDFLGRVVHHFHDPTRSWASAGLFHLFESSVLYQQDAAFVAMWPAARESYRDALLLDDDTQRRAAFVKTLESVGQIIHLVQDAGAPSHTRNDQHLLEDRLHVWVDAHRALIEEYGSIPFTGSLLSPTGDSAAPLPIAYAIDSTTGDRPPPAVATSDGLAEYSNLHFLSDDSLLRSYPHPSKDDLGRCVYSTSPGNSRNYQCFDTAAGEQDYPVATETALQDYIIPGSVEGWEALDDFVLSHYARKLLPRTVGYSTAVIDYFFRGSIEISAPDRYVYGFAAYEANNGGSFTKLRFKVANTTPAEETGAGQLWAVVRYRTAGANLFESPQTALSEPVYAIAGPIGVALSRAATEVAFDFPDGIPTNAADVVLYAVYQGPLGAEEDALVVGSKDLPEPQPIDHANVSDWDCYQGSLHYVGNLPGGDARREIDPDHAGLDLLGPKQKRQQYYKVSSPSGGIVVPNSSRFENFVPNSPVADGVASYSRYVILHDGEGSCASKWNEAVGQLEDENGVIINNYWSAFNLPCITNAIVDGEHVYNGSGNFRGLRGFYVVIWTSRDRSEVIPCLNAMASRTPSLTLVPSTLAAQ